MSEVTICVNDISKVYRLYNKPTDRVKEAMLNKTCHKDFYAVNGVSFEVKKGETIGIIGKNGSGKSTLLKMITGVLTPTSGDIKLGGPVSALLELGTGFDGERNGIENIYLNGNMLGLSKIQIEESIDDILEFADIGDFIYQPVKTYSSGMFVRLAFAVAINIKPEILIIDEALSVGDVRFQQKCYRKIREFKENGTVLFVSHDTGAIASFCDRVIWLDDGKIYKDGAPDEILEDYLNFMRYDIRETEEFTSYVDDEAYEEVEDQSIADEVSKRVKATAFGNGKAKFNHVGIEDEYGKKLTVVESGKKINIILEIKVFEDIDMPILGINLKDQVGNVLIVTNTVFEKDKMKPLKKENKYIFKWNFTFPLFRTGKYSLDVALADGTYQFHEQVHFINDVVIINCSNKELYQEGRGQIVPIDFRLSGEHNVK